MDDNTGLNQESNRMETNKVKEQNVFITDNEGLAAKDYKEVLDEYSSHEFMIRKGRVLDQTPEF